MTLELDSEIIRRVQIRSAAFSEIRKYFAAEDFCEVDAPLAIKANCVESNIDPIKVAFLLPQQTNLYLHTSPEVAAKRLLSHGLTKIYQLSHVFRDGEIGPKHLPEFSLLEWYRVSGDLRSLITDCENMFRMIWSRLAQADLLPIHIYRPMNFEAPFAVKTMEELWLQWAQIDLRTELEALALGGKDDLRRTLLNKGDHISPSATFDDCFHHTMAKYIEPNIGKDVPCVVTKWPSRMAALAKCCENDLLFAERFEIYAGGHELANAFFELTDADEQRKRFNNDNLERAMNGKDQLPVPEAMLGGLCRIPPTSGIAVGIDRLLMVMIGTDQISDVYPLRWNE